MLKKRLFCDRLYLLGLKRALIDKKYTIKIGDQHIILISLNNKEFFRYDQDEFCGFYQGLQVQFILKNIYKGLNENILTICKYDPIFDVNKHIKNLDIVMSMSDYSKANFILSRDKSALVSPRRYYLESFKGSKGYMNNDVYQYVKEQAAKDYELLKQYQKTLIK